MILYICLSNRFHLLGLKFILHRLIHRHMFFDMLSIYFQTNSPLGDFDPINAETPSRTSYQTRIIPHRTTQPISDPFTSSDKTTDDNHQRSLFPDHKKKGQQRRCCLGACSCCSPCYCLLTGLLVAALLGILAAVVTLTTYSSHTASKNHYLRTSQSIVI